jgi:hypothetical protein
MDRKVKILLKGAGLQELLTGGRMMGKQDPPLTAEELAQQEEYYKQHPEVKAAREANAQKAQADAAARAKALTEKTNERNEQSRLAREASNEAYYRWLLSHDRDWLIKHDKVDFTITDRDPVYQLYRRENEQKGLSDEALFTSGQKELAKMKEKLTELENKKLDYRVERAYNLPPNATFKDLVAAYEKALSVGLTPQQKSYSGLQAQYLSLKQQISQLETKLQNPEQRAAEFEKFRKTTNEAELKRLGLKEGATEEEIAQARFAKGEKNWEDSEKFYAQLRRVDEFRAFAREEEQKYLAEANEAMKQIIDKAHEIRDGGGDLIDVEPLLVMADKLKFGRGVMGQVFRIQELALKRGMEFEDYVKGVNDGTVTNEETGKPLEKIVLWDANAAAEEEHQKRMAAIPTSERIAHIAMNLIYKGLDFAVNKVDQLVPVAGKILKRGWEAFAPYGSANFQAGDVGERFKRFGTALASDAAGEVLEQGKKYAGELAGQAGAAAKKMLGFGKTRASRRKAMEKMMDDEVKLHGGQTKKRNQRAVRRSRGI